MTTLGSTDVRHRGAGGRIRALGVALAAGVCFALIPQGAQAQTSPPGLPGPVTPSVSAPNGDPLLPFYSDSGFISLSVDAAGSNDPAGTTIKVHKNVATATVRKAFLFAASTGFSGYTPVNGDVTLDGTPIVWDSAHTIANDIGSVNVEADVTALVQAKINAAPAGDVSFAVGEPNTYEMDGEILAVILNDPSVTTSGSVTLLYGAQNPAGDTFHVALAKPVDKTDPHFGMNLSLGISYGYQPANQYSTVDVNGTRMTSSAGGQDDCDQKYSATPAYYACGNGSLITAGGIGDLNDNPPDPLATDVSCLGALGPAPRCDDELYNLLPFLNNGDSSLTFTTTNPSNDDNIFFAALDVRSSAALVGEGVVLSPTSATNNVGQPHTLTATVQDNNGNPIQNVSVTFTVTSGPNAGTTGSGTTNAGGKATFTYTSSATGTDHIVASFHDASGVLHTSNEVTKTWVSGDVTKPTCTLTGVVAGPPKQIQITAQDGGSGLASIAVTQSTNAVTSVPPFTVGTTSAVVVTSTKINQSLGSTVALRVTDVAGNVTNCDPVLAMAVRDAGKPAGTSYGGLAQDENKITLLNGTPGVTNLQIDVNGQSFHVNGLADGASRVLDVSSAMHAGNDNAVTVTARGKPTATVTVVISD